MFDKVVHDGHIIGPVVVKSRLNSNSMVSSPIRTFFSEKGFGSLAQPLHTFFPILDFYFLILTL
jgi:hypothetical protein